MSLIAENLWCFITFWLFIMQNDIGLLIYHRNWHSIGGGVEPSSPRSESQATTLACHLSANITCLCCVEFSLLVKIFSWHNLLHLFVWKDDIGLKCFSFSMVDESRFKLWIVRLIIKTELYVCVLWWTTSGHHQMHLLSLFYQIIIHFLHQTPLDLFH